MEIVKRKIIDLKNYERNARIHPDNQLLKIAASIKSFGFNDPVEIDENDVIIAGHARVEAAKILGIEEIPTIKHAHLSSKDKKAYILAANRISLDSEWDSKLLKEEFSNLISEDVDLTLSGFTTKEIELTLNSLDELETEFNSDAEDCPELEEKETTQLNDVWLLGRHRLICGDSTNPSVIENLFRNDECNLMVTDPPYGVNYDPEWRENVDLGMGRRSKGKVKNDDRIDWSETYSLFPGDIVYIWHAGKYTGELANNLTNCGFKLISQIIWAKQHFVLSRGDYHWQHEPCWYAVREQAKNHNWQGSRKESTIWEIDNNNSFGNINHEETWGHGTQKPIECMARPIRNNSQVGDWVYDPFSGSGTTLIACELLGRKCLMIELDPKYCDMIIRRWEKFTGRKAILEQTGEEFCG